MPTLNGILETALYVEDPERSAEFYRALFAFEMIDSSDRLIAMRIADRQVLLLFKKGASAKQPMPAHDADGQLHLAFAIDAAELEEWEDSLADKGVTIEEKRKWQRGGQSLY